MPTSNNWNNSTYSIPIAGEVNWSALTNFLVALASNAQTISRQLIGYRTATATPVTVNATTDATIVTKLTVPGAVAVTLPNLGATGAGNLLVVTDGTGDASTNNVTISPSGGATINGAATYVISQDRGSVILVYDGTSNWSAVSSAGAPNAQTLRARIATSSPVTVTAVDAVVVTNLTVAGAVAVTLPSGVSGRTLAIVDGKGDAATNNITITPAGGQTINGAATLVLNTNNHGVLLAYDGGTNWRVIARYVSKYVAPTISGVALYEAGAEARFQNAGATHYAGIKAAAGTTTDVSYTLPTADGTTGFVLQTNGSGALSWVSAASASVDQGVLTTDVSTASQTIASGKTLTYPYLSIPVGQTYTINGQYIGAGDLTVNGTLVVNGTSNILT